VVDIQILAEKTFAVITVKAGPAGKKWDCWFSDGRANA